MSQDVAKPPLISSPAEASSFGESDAKLPQRKCGVHQQQEQQEQQSRKKRSVDAVVESFLDEHPAFLDDYVRRKISRRQLERWLFLPFHKDINHASHLKPRWMSKGLVHNSDPNLIKTGNSLSSSCVRGQPEGGHQRQRSRSFTPLRKLSATTFEAGGLATPILATTSDGQPSFLRTLSASMEKSLRPSIGPSSANSPDNTQVSNRKELLLSLLPEIFQSASTAAFAKVLMKSANLLLGQASHVEVLLLRAPNTPEAVVFAMQNDFVRETPVDANENIRSNSLLASVLSSSQVLNVNELPASLGSLPFNNNALMGPLQAGNKVPLGCLQLYDKPGGFNDADENLFRHFLALTSVALSSLLEQQETKLELARSEVFLELARTVFRDPTRLESTMLIILSNFLSLIDCERCQISLCEQAHPSVFKRVFDLQRKDLNKQELDRPFEDRLPIKSEITTNVAITGQKVNLDKSELQSNTEDGLKSFLSMPIRDPDGLVVGVISLANKEAQREEERSFTGNDERFIEAFAIFCGMAIRNASDYERAIVSEAKLQVAFEVMNYQAASNADEASQLASLAIPAASSLTIDSFDFNYLNLDDNATLTATMRMFIDLGLVKRFSIDHSTLCRWLLTVKRNYRNETVQYHNWYHAFNVTQMMFCMLLKTRWNTLFSTVDVLGLIVACISHDLDHRGTNNSFQHKMNNPLAKLYSTSTLERHHLNQCLLILTLKGNKILENLTKDEYAQTLAVIERSILATDLALHFKEAPALSALAQLVNQSDEALANMSKSEASKKHLLQAGMMTAADLGAATKPWQVHEFVSRLIAEEFWTQGDIERREFKIEPTPMFDRSVGLEVVQVDFLDSLCLPLYEDMALFSSEFQPILDGCRANRRRWATLQRSNEDSPQKNNEIEQARNL